MLVKVASSCASRHWVAACFGVCMPGQSQIGDCSYARSVKQRRCPPGQIQNVLMTVLRCCGETLNNCKLGVGHKFGAWRSSTNVVVSLRKDSQLEPILNIILDCCIAFHVGKASITAFVTANCSLSVTRAQIDGIKTCKSAVCFIDYVRGRITQSSQDICTNDVLNALEQPMPSAVKHVNL